MNSLFALVAAFNLVCSGENTTGALYDLNAKKTDVTITLRVDLDTKRWCSGDCKFTTPIHEIRDTQIIFKLKDDGSGDDEIFFVNRETGEFMDRKRFRSIKWINMTNGMCERADFTGFPQRRF